MRRARADPACRALITKYMARGCVSGVRTHALASSSPQLGHALGFAGSRLAYFRYDDGVTPRGLVFHRKGAREYNKGGEICCSLS